ncbi:MAG: hypothetical protein KTR35_07065 [Gammaproteobacteria bacterium]|nr:hypothetical protein [Gammaproteobacteria bacterium]
MNDKFRFHLAMCLGALALLFGSANAQAEDYSYKNDSYVVFNTFAYHFKNADKRNAVTPGIGFEYSPTQKLGFHVGTARDSFGYQAKYFGLNYATPRYAALGGRVRFIVGATILNKQYHPNSEAETKVVPLPVVEFTLSERAVLNVSGSPEIDFGEQHNNAVVFFQFKLNM